MNLSEAAGQVCREHESKLCGEVEREGSIRRGNDREVPPTQKIKQKKKKEAEKMSGER